MGERINIQEYLDMIKRRKWIIILIVLLSLAFGGFRMYENYVSYVPEYSSVITVKIDTMKTQKEEARKEREKKDKSGKSDSTGDASDSQGEDGASGQTDSAQTDSGYLFNYSALAQDEAIASRYYNYATDASVYKKVAQVAGVRERDIESISAVENEETPEMIEITVISGNREAAQLAANAIPEVYGDVLLMETGMDCVSTVYEASPGTVIPRKTDTSVPRYGLGGLVIAIFIVLLLEILNTKIITPDDVEKYWELPLLGVVPEFDDVPHKKRGNKKSNVKGSNTSTTRNNNVANVKGTNANTLESSNISNTNTTKNNNISNTSKKTNVPHTEGSQMKSNRGENNNK